MDNEKYCEKEREESKDRGNRSIVFPLRKETCCNENFRTALWTGEYLQVTVMTIQPGCEVGLEFHDDLDQFFYIESGVASVYMGKAKQCVRFLGKVMPNYAVIVPAETWHNIVNEQSVPLKMFSVYAPPKHPFGTVHRTKMDSDLAEKD